MTATFEISRPVDYLERLASSDLGSAYKAMVVTELGISPGDMVLDLGCGPGADLPAFARAAGPTGRVVGLDVDAAAVALAQERVASLANVTVEVGDIHAPDLPDASVDRVHTDRVLQHVADPLRVVESAGRVLRPGGRIALAEPDWDTLVVDYPDPTVAVAYRAFVTDRVVRNARIGRQLPRLAERCGLTVQRVLPITATFRDAEEADRVLGFARVTRRAVAAGYLDGGAAERWLHHLATAPFLASVTLFMTVAERR